MNAAPPSLHDPLQSFRDPDGRLLRIEGRIFRIVRESAVSSLNAFLASSVARDLAAQGCLVSTRVLDAASAAAIIGANEARAAPDGVDADLVLEHERIPFQAFPYEWPPEMLHAAALLTLNIAEKLLPEGFGLKDATPYNVLFRGPNPVFVDLLSMEQREPSDATWLAYGQFTRTFLLPLLVNARLGLPLGPLLAARRDGLEPEEVYRMSTRLRRVLSPELTLVSLPTWLARRAGHSAEIYKKRSAGRPEKAQFILGSLFRQLRRTMARLEPRDERRSRWSGYMASDLSYTEPQFGAKREFVERALADLRPARVLDIGCNTGFFSTLAARAGASVVAMDSDPVVVGRAWRAARAERLDVLPLVVDFSRPSPGLGWRNEECPPFLERARGAFDCVLMLALTHHLLVNERIPLDEILAVAAGLTARALVIEFVAPSDPMFQKIARGRDHLFNDLSRESFEAACSRRFRLVRSARLGELDRWLYLLEK